MKARAAVLAVSTGVAAVGTVPAAHAAPQPAPRVEAVSLSAASVTTRGLTLARVTVTVSVTGWPDDLRSVFLMRTSRSPEPSATRTLLADLGRISGTTGSGTYRGTLYVPSTAAGTWRVWSVGDVGPESASLGAFTTERDPRADGVPDATLTVHGTHLPRLRLSIVPRPLPYPRTRYTAVATYSYADTGRPIAGRPVVIGFDNECAENILTSGPRTDGAGRRTASINDPYGFVVCAWAPLPVPAPTSRWSIGYAAQGTGAAFGVRIAAAPARGSVRLGSSVTVTGNVLAVGGTPRMAAAARTSVRLQRLAGRTWRNVNIARVTASGRLHLVATPPTRGRHLYRVWFPSQGRFAGALTRSFTITAR